MLAFKRMFEEQRIGDEKGWQMAQTGKKVKKIKTSVDLVS